MDEDEEEAATAEVDVDDEVAWASLGGVGCCGVGCCGVGCCCGDWATPEPRWPLPPPAPPGPPPAPPRSAMARPGVRGAGSRELKRRREDAQAFPPAAVAAGARLVSSARPPSARASEKLHAGAGPPGAQPSRSPAAACCGSRRRDTEWACPRAPLGGPTQRRGAGPGLARAPLAAPERGRRPARRAGPSRQLRVVSQPTRLPPPPSSFRRSGLASGNPAFPGRGPGPERAVAGARLGPSGLRSREEPPPLPARFPAADLARVLSRDQRRERWTPSGRPPPLLSSENQGPWPRGV